MEAKKTKNLQTQPNKKFATQQKNYKIICNSSTEQGQ